MTAEQILNEAFRLGRDLESHASEQETDPDNWDAICEYAAEGMTQLAEQLTAIGAHRPGQEG